MGEMNRENCHKILFQSRYICGRNISIAAKGIWESGSELARFRDGRELVENEERGSRPKSTRTAVNIAAVAADLIKKSPSNRINNDNTIFEHHSDCSSFSCVLLSRFFLFAR
jgi:hypothetical protein